MKKIVILLALLSGSIYAGPCSPKAAVKAAQTINEVLHTLALIKPDAVTNKYIGQIIELIEKNGFHIARMEHKQITKQEAEKFYAEHKGKPFFKALVEYITSGPVVILALKKENAVADWRKLLGKTDPKQANVGTIRKMFAESKERNAAHGSDSLTSAQRELAFFFPNL